MRSRRKHLMLIWISTAALTLTGLTGCGANSAEFVDPGESEASISLTPESGVDKAPVSSEIGILIDNGTLVEVTMSDDSGSPIDGKLSRDKTSWIPDKPLKYHTTYTAVVTANDKHRLPTAATTTFTTMKKPTKLLTAQLWNNPDYKYGQAIPVMIDFPSDFEVPEKYRAGVERRLFVTSEPRQDGVWHWFTGNHLEFRPEKFWQPGTTITVRAALTGLPLGKGYYGSKDITETLTIDSTSRSIKVTDKSKEMVAIKDGKEVKAMDISLGKSSTPSYSGTMPIMEQLEHTIFDTTASCGGQVSGDNCYRTPVDWAQRLTWSGQFIHSAPWSVGDQGVRNVSHGCINVSASNAEWIFKFAKVGDPVIINGTGTDLPYGDGYTAFDMSWEDFVKGSYLPVPDHQDSEDNKDSDVGETD